MFNFCHHFKSNSLVHNSYETMLVIFALKWVLTLKEIVHHLLHTDQLCYLRYRGGKVLLSNNRYVCYPNYTSCTIFINLLFSDRRAHHRLVRIRRGRGNHIVTSECSYYGAFYKGSSDSYVFSLSQFLWGYIIYIAVYLLKHSSIYGFG